MTVSEDQVAAFQQDGAVLLPGLMADWVPVIERGIARNMADPGPYAAENLDDNEAGRFFDDYCNWRRIAEFEDVARHGPLAAAAASLMASDTVQLFHDHVLVKEPGTAKPTPWHQDAPYYFVDGSQTVSFWIPVDPVDTATLRLIAGSHRWPRAVRPIRWKSEQDFYRTDQEFAPIPDPDANPGQYRILEWRMRPGDAVAFSFRTAHGARGNIGGQRRRAFSLRLVGDDARYVERPSPTSPPFPGHGMVAGQRLRPDWFPMLWP